MRASCKLDLLGDSLHDKRVLRLNDVERAGHLAGVVALADDRDRGLADGFVLGVFHGVVGLCGKHLGFAADARRHLGHGLDCLATVGLVGDLGDGRLGDAHLGDGEGALGGAGVVALATTFDGGAPVLVDDYTDAFLQLDSGEVEAVACDLSIASYQMSKTGDKYSKLDEPLSLEHYAVGFKLGDEETAKVVTNTLKVLYEEGVVEDLCKDYERFGISFANWVLR